MLNVIRLFFSVHVFAANGDCLYANASETATDEVQLYANASQLLEQVIVTLGKRKFRKPFSNKMKYHFSLHCKSSLKLPFVSM